MNVDLTFSELSPIEAPGRRGPRVGSLAAHAATYLIERRRRGEITRGSALRASYTLRSLDASFGNRPLDHFGTRAIERWLESHPEWKPGTRHTYLARVKSFAAWLRRRKLIARDVFDELAMPKKPKPSPRPMARGEISALLLGTPDTRARLVVTLQWSLGLRCMGVANLRLEDVDHIANVITVREKYGNERVLPITVEVRRAIDAYLAEHPSSSGPLIRSQKRPWAGISAGYVSSLVARWMRDTGVKARAFDGKGAHALRHTALTDLARISGDPFLVQRLAGWANVGTAAVYVGAIDTDLLRTALEKREPL